MNPRTADFSRPREIARRTRLCVTFSKITFDREALRHRKERHLILLLWKLEIAFLGDLEGSQQELGFFSKELPHLACGSKVIALGLISQSVRIVEVSFPSYAEQRIVRLVSAGSR